VDELCRTGSPVDIPQDLSAQRRTKYWLWIFLAPIIVLANGEWNVIAGYQPVDTKVAMAGLRIVAVAPNSAAAQAGLRYGDVLIAYNRRRITNEEQFDAVIRFFQRQFDRTGKRVTADLSLYRDGVMSVRTFCVPLGRLGINTREWTLAGAFVEDAIAGSNDYVSAEKYADEAAASGRYTSDQLLHMRILCLNNEKDGDKIRQIQVDELYRKYPLEKLRLFANYDLLYNKRYRAGAAVFEKYLKIKRVDVSTELTLASCYAEIGKYDDAEALLLKVAARPATDPNAASEYARSVVSNIRARVYMGRGQYDRAQERFEKALEEYPDDPYYILAFLYCAARREVAGEKPGEFEAAYKVVSARSHKTEKLMGYHIDALRAFVLVKRQHISVARATVLKWKDSADAKRYIPVFWRSFPEGAEIIQSWNLLLGQQVVPAGTV
jgi:tetratricopeptide (TPR) repeat protein